MTARRRPVLVALLPMVWSVRNVVYGGVLRRLADANVAVRLLLLRDPPDAAAAPHPDLALADAMEAMVAPPRRPGRADRGKALVDELLRSAFARRHRLASYPIYRSWALRHASPRARLRARAIDAAAGLAAGPRATARLIARSEAAYRAAHELEPVRAQLRRLAPDLLWSTVCVAPPEYPYRLAAHDLHVPTVASVLSFDNLTSRGLVPPYDHYLVWGAPMRAEVQRFYPHATGAHVTVTGTPQFDFHVLPAYRWSRAETLQRLGLPPDARYLLYSASHEHLAPAEPQLVAELVRRLRAHARLSALHVVVRLHPLENWARWQGALDASDRVRLSPAWDAPPAPDGWTLASPTDQARLVSTLAHASASVNVASTMTLDAAVLDRPVIGIDFADEAAAPREILYAEYGADHYRPLVAAGGLRLARGWSELLDLVGAALDEPERDRAARARMVREVCGPVDGRAADRVADALLRLLDGRPVDARAAPLAAAVAVPA